MKDQVCRIVRYMLIFSFIFQSSFFFSVNILFVYLAEL